MGHGNGEADVSHPLAAHFLLGDFDVAPVADDTTVADTLVFSAIALIVLGGTEDLLAEETVPFGLVGPVVDRFRFQDFAAGPLGDVFGRRQGDADCLEIVLYLSFLIVESRHS